MNIDRLSTLAAWLEDGAPGVAFNMFTFRHTIGTVLGPEGDPCDAPMIKRQVAAKGWSLSDICCGLMVRRCSCSYPSILCLSPRIMDNFRTLPSICLASLGCVRGRRGIAGMISLTQVMRHQIAAPSRPQKRYAG